MNRTIRNIIFLAAMAILPAAVSCQEDDTLQYNNVTMGNVVAGTFISDQGNIFNVVEQNCTGKIDTMKRAIVVCDVLRKSEGTDGAYDIRLNMLNSVLTKSPLTMSEMTDEDALVTDPVHIKEIWYSGGYLNMYVAIPIRNGSKNPHLINLVLDDSATSGNSYVFELRHNGFGEIWSELNSDFVLAGAYVSFPIGEVIKGNEAKVTLKWKWHKEVGSGWNLEVVDNDLEFKWERGGFEQAPLSLASKAASEIM